MLEQKWLQGNKISILPWLAESLVSRIPPLSVKCRSKHVLFWVHVMWFLSCHVTVSDHVQFVRILALSLPVSCSHLFSAHSRDYLVYLYPLGSLSSCQVSLIVLYVSERFSLPVFPDLCFSCDFLVLSYACVYAVDYGLPNLNVVCYWFDPCLEHWLGWLANSVWSACWLSRTSRLYLNPTKSWIDVSWWI